MGNDLTNADIASNVTNIQITPTRSIFVMKAGPMNVTVTFLSPVEVSGSLEWRCLRLRRRPPALEARRLGQAVDSFFLCIRGSSVIGWEQLSSANVL